MVLSGLRQADVQSLSSDGALFTHYLLLFYEVIASLLSFKMVWNFRATSNFHLIEVGHG